MRWSEIELWAQIMVGLLVTAAATTLAAAIFFGSGVALLAALGCALLLRDVYRRMRVRPWAFIRVLPIPELLGTHV